jgi:hypothetical protein
MAKTDKSSRNKTIDFSLEGERNTLKKQKKVKTNLSNKPIKEENYGQIAFAIN